MSGTYKTTLTVTSSAGKATQKVTFQVGVAPTITSAATAFGSAGNSFSLHIATSGTPAAALSESGTLPPGVRWSAKGQFKGKLAADSRGTYEIVITASNAFGTAKQYLTITVT